MSALDDKRTLKTGLLAVVNVIVVQRKKYDGLPSLNASPKTILFHREHD